MGCSVSGVGEAIIRAGLARDVTAAAADTATDLDAACSAALEEGILQARLTGIAEGLATRERRGAAGYTACTLHGQLHIPSLHLRQCHGQEYQKLVRQAPWQPKDCGVLAVRVQPRGEAGSGHTAESCHAGSCGCSDESRLHVTLAAVHCSASMGIAYCTGNRQQPRPAAPAGSQQDGLKQQQQQQQAAGTDDGVHSQATAREHANSKPIRAVHVQFLRQAVPDAARPPICSFATSV